MADSRIDLPNVKPIHVDMIDGDGCWYHAGYKRRLHALIVKYATVLDDAYAAFISNNPFSDVSLILAGFEKEIFPLIITDDSTVYTDGTKLTKADIYTGLTALADKLKLAKYKDDDDKHKRIVLYYINIINAISPVYMGAVARASNVEYLQHVRMRSRNISQLILMLGSNRLSKAHDAKAMVDNTTGSIYQDLEELLIDLSRNKYMSNLPVTLDRFTVADVYGNTRNGENFQTVLIGSDQYPEFEYFDHNKFTNLYAVMHYLAKKYIKDEYGAPVVLNFCDDNIEILNTLASLLKKYDVYVPVGLTLNLNQYTGGALKLIATICGRGKVDYNYRKNLHLIAKICEDKVQDVFSRFIAIKPTIKKYFDAATQLDHERFLSLRTTSKSLTEQKNTLVVILDADGCVYGDPYICVQLRLLELFGDELFKINKDTAQPNDLAVRMLAEIGQVNLFDLQQQNLVASIAKKYAFMAKDPTISASRIAKIALKEFLYRIEKISPAIINALIIKANTKLFEFLQNEVVRHQYQRVVFMIGSSRQSYAFDTSNAKNHATRLFVKDIKVLMAAFQKQLTNQNHHVTCSLDKALVADLIGREPFGESFQRSLAETENLYFGEHRQAFFDESKVALTYFWLHYLASRYKHEYQQSKLAVIMLDDKKDKILARIQKSAAFDPALFPARLPMALIEYLGSSLEICWNISGTGVIDRDLRASILDIMRLSDVISIDTRSTNRRVDFSKSHQIEAFMNLRGKRQPTHVPLIADTKKLKI